MFKCFFPDEYVDSTYVIDFDNLYAQGYNHRRNKEIDFTKDRR